MTNELLVEGTGRAKPLIGGRVTMGIIRTECSGMDLRFAKIAIGPPAFG
jgi:hypothetical protein